MNATPRRLKKQGRFRSIRHERRLKLVAVEAASGVTASNISRIERGKQVPRMLTAHALLSALGESTSTIKDLRRVFPRFAEDRP
jgi:transcriptional regulator with XRE-family HTH domain